MVNQINNIVILFIENEQFCKTIYLLFIHAIWTMMRAIWFIMWILYSYGFMHVFTINRVFRWSCKATNNQNWFDFAKMCNIHIPYVLVIATKQCKSNKRKIKTEKENRGREIQPFEIDRIDLLMCFFFVRIFYTHWIQTQIST